MPGLAKSGPGRWHPPTAVESKPPNLPCCGTSPLPTQGQELHLVPVKCNNMPNPAALAKPVGEPHAVTATCFTQPSAQESELESCWMAASITATPALPEKAAT